MCVRESTTVCPRKTLSRPPSGPAWSVNRVGVYAHTQTHRAADTHTSPRGRVSPVTGVSQGVARYRID